MGVTVTFRTVVTQQHPFCTATLIPLKQPIIKSLSRTLLPLHCSLLLLPLPLRFLVSFSIHERLATTPTGFSCSVWLRWTLACGSPPHCLGITVCAEKTMRRFILARQLCCVRGCSAMSSRNNRKDQAGLRSDQRALHPTSTPSVPLAVIQPNQRCLLVQLSLAWNERTSTRATMDAFRTR